MKRNTASQVIGAQMVAAADGSAFSGSVTVHVTGDGGTQATGSVGSGACTHEGNGFHTYAPAQAETDYAHVAFTFTGSGAIPATVQVYPTFPQTGDAFTRLGAPAGASVSADVAAIKAAVDTIDDYVDTEVAAIKAKTDNLPSDPADASDIAASFSTVNSTLATIAGYIDTEVAAIKSKTDLIPSSPAAVGDIPTSGAIADAVWDEAVDGTITARQSVRLANSALGGKASGLETTSAVFRDLADTKDRITATVDADGNRTAVTRDLT